MDKETLIKVAVVGAVLLFLLEPLAINLLNAPSNQIDAQKIKQGEANFTLRLTSYENYIVLPNEEEIKKELEKEGIKYSIVSDSILVETDDPFLTYRKLGKVGGESKAIFEVVEGMVDSVKLNISTIPLSVEPIFFPNATIKATGVVVYDEEGRVYGLEGLTPDIKRGTVKINATVVEKIRDIYIYEVDWENRTRLKEIGRNYTNIVKIKGIKNDTNITDFSSLDFVEYVGDGYIIVKDGFNDKEEIEKYFEVEEYPKEVIRSEERLDIPFAEEKKVGVYRVENKELGISKEVEGDFEINSTVEIEVDAILSGENIVGIA